MEPTEENLKNTENAFKDMYSRLHNVPRSDLEDIPVDELTNLESSLSNRANKIRFKEIKAVNTQSIKKEDLGKKEYTEEVVEKIKTPEAVEVKPEKSEKTAALPEVTEKNTVTPSNKSVPDITDLDKRLKAETAMLPEPPSITEPKKIEVITPEQEESLRKEYSFFDFDKKPKNDDEAKRLDNIKRDLLSKLEEKKLQQPVDQTQNVVLNSSEIAAPISIPELDIEKEQKLRTEYPFFDFDKKPKDETEAKWLEQFKKDLLTNLEQNPQQIANQPVISEPFIEKTIKQPELPQEPITPVETSKSSNKEINSTEPLAKNIPEPVIKNQEPGTPENNQPFNLPEPIAATVESLKGMNVGNINEMIDQMTAVAMGFQKNAPINESTNVPTSTSESSLKSINDNLATLNKASSVSTKELKASIDNLRSVAEQILQYLPNIQSNNIISSNTAQNKEVKQVNTGLLQRYKNEVRQQYGADVIDLSNNRPTMPGFTI